MQQSQITLEKYKAPSRSLLSNVIVALFASGLLIWSFRLLQQNLTSITSEDAVVNGVLIDVKAPQQGIVTGLAVNTGELNTQGKTLLTLKNRQVSEMPIQALKSKLNQKQSELERARTQLNHQLALSHRAIADEQNQSRLETFEAGKLSSQAAANLQAAQSRYQLAQLTQQRTAFLKSQGATSQAVLDAATLEMQQRRAEVDSLKNQVNALNANQQAAQLGLSLTKTRSDSDPRLRLEALEMQIADQRQVVKSLEQAIQDTRSELAQAQADVRREQVMAVKTPATGVFWRLHAQQGKFVERGESLGQVLDCSKRWIDAFVDEQKVRSLHPGTPATITLYGSGSQTLQGRVSTIRPGTGRLAAGEDVAIPNPPNLPRKAQVRIDLNPTTTQSDSGSFCFVGYTGKVAFRINE